MNVVLTHLWADGNKGDAAITRAQVRLIRRVFPDAILTAVSVFGRGDRRLRSEHQWCLANGVQVLPAVFASPAIVRAGNAPIHGWAKRIYFMTSLIEATTVLLASVLRWPGLVRSLTPAQTASFDAIRKADAVLSKGGAYYFSLPGLRGLAYTARTCWIVWIALLWRRRVIVLPHSFGPFPGRIARLLLRKTLSGCFRLMCREAMSVAALQELGVPGDRVVQVPDMAFALAPPDEDEAARTRRRFDLHTPARLGRLLVTVRPCESFTSVGVTDRYLEQTAQVLAHYLEVGWEVVLVPQVTGPEDREDDRRALQVLWEKLSRRGLAERLRFIRAELNVEELMAIYEAGDLLLGTRMHSVILAAMVGTPAVAIAYLGPKHRGIMQELGVGEYCLDVTTFEAATARGLLDALWRQHSAVGRRLRSRTAQWRGEIAEQLAAVLGSP